MRALKITALAVLAALPLAAAPASANPFPHHHHHDGFWGGPGFVFGLAGMAIAGAVAADAYCVRYEPVYDDEGNYMGRRRVDMC